MAEESDLKSVQSRFESEDGYYINQFAYLFLAPLEGR